MWLKLDDTYADHPKVEEALTIAGPGAVLLHVRLMCYCAKHLTDGFVPIRATKRLASDAGKGTLPALVRSGLLVPKEGGYELPDWLDYNPSRASVERKRERDRKRLARDSRTDRARTDDDPPANRSVPSRPVPSSSEGRDRRDPSGQSATAREEPERNPHEPQEAAPPERRTLLGAEHERLAAVIVRELDEARGHAPASSDRPADLSRLAQLCRQHGAAALQVARRYVADEHPSTAAKTVRELLGCWDRMRGLVDRPAATASRRGGRGYDQLDPEIVALYAEEG